MLMTIISKRLECEKGVTSIEAAILILFFVGLLIYAFHQCFVMTMSYSATKLSSQVATIISQRSTLFSNSNLSQSDVNNIKKYITSLADDKKRIFDVYIEEISYHDGAYSMYYLPASKQQCSLNKRLSSYDIALKTSYGKKNSLYRVSVCKKITEAFFSSDKLIVSGITVLPGQHH
ncbi:tight adherence pilus pseudopilin TadF [Enterobacter sp. 22325]|uniref:tight adherence pilus pseudopilin TadF n=1 Tax=Enterobacter sp. 22325 TaxID=3453911 RepID=UPI003F852CD7